MRPGGIRGSGHRPPEIGGGSAPDRTGFRRAAVRRTAATRFLNGPCRRVSNAPRPRAGRGTGRTLCRFRNAAPVPARPPVGPVRIPVTAVTRGLAARTRLVLRVRRPVHGEPGPGGSCWVTDLGSNPERARKAIVPPDRTGPSRRWTRCGSGSGHCSDGMTRDGAFSRVSKSGRTVPDTCTGERKNEPRDSVQPGLRCQVRRP